MGTKNVDLLQDLKNRVNGALAEPTVQEYLGSPELVWGPALCEQDKLSSNTLHVVRIEDTYVIATAGTNPISVYDWAVEDFDVSKQVDWPHRQHIRPGLHPKIAEGTNIGLNFLLEMKSNGQTLIDFLNDLMTKENKVSLTVTRYSLGGALSPTLALNLLDRQDEWDHGKPVEIKVLPFAGPPPGNADFATYYDQRLGLHTKRIWNNIDIVPYFREKDLLETIPSLYEPYIKWNMLVKGLVHKAIQNASAGGNYKQLVPHTKPLQGEWSWQRLAPSGSQSDEEKKAVEKQKKKLEEALNEAVERMVNKFSPCLVKLPTST
ncbi:MAG: lipase family protein [Moorea sp. SIO2B7]|nr:lipase family protein [Moorena sp. SIO2B7]